MTRTIDMTPTWPEAMRMCRLVIENGTPEGQAQAWAEVERMAEIAQAHVDVQARAAATVTGSGTPDDLADEDSQWTDGPAALSVRWTMTDLKEAMGFKDLPMSSLSFRLRNDGDLVTIRGNAVLEVTT